MMKSRLLLSLVGTVTLLVAACSNGTDRSSVAIEELVERYGYDAETATLTPSYAIVPEYEHPSDAYARDLLAAECLKDVVSYQVQKPEENEFLDGRTHQILFDEELARTWGYSAMRLNTTGGDGVEDSALTDEVHEKMVTCGEKANERLGDPPARPVSAVEDAGWIALDSSEEVAAAHAAWVKCMEPLGVVDLPDSPNGMPSRSVRSPGSLTELQTGRSEDVELDRSTPPDEREIEVAVADARCREKTDVDGIEFRARVRGELEALADDVETFEAARIEYQEYQRRVDEVIAELGG